MVESSIVTIGTFDGVHIGHRHLIRTLLRRAKESNRRPLVVTFDCHPMSIICPDRAPKRIQTPLDEMAALQALGVDVEMLHFDEKIQNLSALDWIRRMQNDYNASEILMGYDNKFGADCRLLDSNGYRDAAASLGMELNFASELPGVSSRNIRAAILNGNMPLANEMLGRPFQYPGKVVHGQALGRTIGFPTANIVGDSDMLVPASGVYAARIIIGNDLSGKPSVVNIGRRPTVTNNGEEAIEAHIIGEERNLYDCTMKIDFVRKIRDERKFDSLLELKAQINNDIETALKCL